MKLCMDALIAETQEDKEGYSENALQIQQT